MSDDTNTLEVVARVTTEAEASLIVQFLADRGIEATQVGGFTSGLKAEAPGDVSVLVKRSDLQRAKTALAEKPQEWSPEEMKEAEVSVEEKDKAVGEESANDESGSGLVDHLWWIVEIIGLSFILIAYLFTHSFSLLFYGVAIVLILALCLSLMKFIRRR